MAFAVFTSAVTLVVAPPRAQSEIGAAAGIGSANEAAKGTSGSQVGEVPPGQSASQDSPLHFQAVEGSGSIMGAVVDANGTGVPGAQITLSNTSTLEHYTLESAEDGEFAFAKVAPGTYFVTVEAKGFDPYTSGKITLSAGQVFEMSGIQLSIAPQKQVVVVPPTEVIAQVQMKRRRSRGWSAFCPISTRATSGMPRR
jgi:hypothetical protein